ncbi:MAG: hypothetical protein KF705_12445 [Phycisphaeraceae bacterium]|nr:hypothetical protein [Phycisphaeraceae bacterium]
MSSVIAFQYASPGFHETMVILPEALMALKWMPCARGGDVEACQGDPDSGVLR